MERDSNRPVVEKNLFHGTSRNVIDSICRNNFDWRLCGAHGTMYGQGTHSNVVWLVTRVELSAVASLNWRMSLTVVSKAKNRLIYFVVSILPFSPWCALTSHWMRLLDAACMLLVRSTGAASRQVAKECGGALWELFGDQQLQQVINARHQVAAGAYR